MEVESNIELDVQKDFEHYKDENIEMDKVLFLHSMLFFFK